MQAGLQGQFVEEIKKAIHSGVMEGIQVGVNVGLSQGEVVIEAKLQAVEVMVQGLQEQNMRVVEAIQVMATNLEAGNKAGSKEVVKAIKDLGKDQALQAASMKSKMQAIQEEVKGLKRQWTSEGWKESNLWEVMDRCDKIGNKVEVIERRLERMMQEYNDTCRAMVQDIQRWRASIAGNMRVDGEDTGKVDRRAVELWLQVHEDNWRNARCRLQYLQ